MSTTVDERVVSLQFDNRDFEKNVQTTMSTLEKFKQKLNFTGTSKGLEQVSVAANKVDMTGLARGVETVHAKFSALQVMGVTALSNITNSAVNAGKRMVSALTIDPIKTGFQEYETQINSVQTILANTKSKGSTIDDVNAALDELNKYADQTIYNFTEMTRNIGTFTAAGVDLETSTNAIQGIANLAAVSGSTSQQASTAMYQLSQALSAGRVALMDWRSVENASMGGELFRNALKETSELLGTGAEAAIKAKGSFRDSLQEGWLTSEVLTETLKKFTTSGANEYVAEYTGLTKEAVEETLEAAKAQYGEAEAIDKAAEALAKKSGKNKDEIKEALEFAKTATDAATKVKTFTQLWDVIKESVQSGWAQTWKLILGDFEEAKALFTPLSDFLTGIINKMSKARNTVLGSALGKSFTDVVDKVKGITKPVTDSAKAVKDVVKSIEDYANVVDEIIGGKWGNGQERWDALTQAGYDWAHAQNLVNEKLGDSKRHATDYKEAQNGVAESTEKVTETQAKQIAKLTELSDEQLKNKGYTDEQIKNLRELEKQADKLGMPIEDFINNVDQLNGRFILISGFKNIGQSIITIFKSLGEAWRDAFDPISGDDIYNIIAGFHKFTTYLKINKEAAEDLTNTFKGVFAILDLISMITGGAFKIAFKIIQEVLKALGYVDVDILSITGDIGKAIASFRDWIEEHNILFRIIEKVVPALVSFGKAVWNVLKALYELPLVQKGVNKLSSAFDFLSNTVGKRVLNFIDMLGKLDEVTFDSVKEAFDKAFGSILDMSIDLTDKFDFLPVDLISGFVKGIKDGGAKAWDVMVELGKTILDGIKDFLGIHSPSTKAIELMEWFIDGIVIGIRNGIQKVIDSAKLIAEPFLNLFEDFDWNRIFTAFMASGAIVTGYKFADALQSLFSPLDGVGDILSNVADTVETFTKHLPKLMKKFAGVMSGITWNLKTKAIQNIAISIAILAGSLFLISLIDADRLWESVGVLGVLVAIIGVLTWAVSKMDAASATWKKGEGLEISGLKTALINMGIALILTAAAMKIIGSMKPEQYQQGIYGMIVIISLMTILMYVIGNVMKGDSVKEVDKFGTLMKRLAISMILMVAAIKLISLIKKDEVGPALKFIGAFTVFILAIAFIADMVNENGNLDKLGGMMIKMAIAMALMVGVVKLVSYLSDDEMKKGVKFAAGFLGFIAILLLVLHLAPDKIVDKLGSTLLSIAVSMAIMVGVVKLVSYLSPDEMKQGVLFAVGFLVFLALLMSVLKIGKEKDIAKVGVTILAISVAMAIMAALCIVLGMIDLSTLATGLVAMTWLTILIAGLIVATGDAKDCKGSIMAMAVAIGVMAAAIVILSFIDPTKLIGPVLAMTILMGMFALILKCGSNITSSIGPLIVMTVAIGILTIALILLSKIPFERAMGASVALSLVMLSMAVALAIISKMGANLSNAILGAIGLLALAIPMLAFVGILALMQNIKNAETNAILMAQLMLAMSLVLIPLTIIGNFAAQALLGVLGLTAMALPMLVFVGILALMQNIKNAEANAMLITGLMTSMTACLVAISLVAPLLTIGVAAMYGLVGLVVAVGVLATAIGALVTEFPSLQTMLDTGIPLMIQIAGGLGEMVGAFLGGIAETLMSLLPKLGLSLSMFMMNATPFIVGAKMIDSSVIDGVSAIAKAILILTAADILTGITSFFTGESSLTSFGKEIAEFGPYLKQFADSVAGIDPETIRAAAEAGKNLAQMADTVPNEGGLAGFFAGENSLASFGPQILSFGECLKGFATTVAGADFEPVKAAVEAGKAIIKMADTVPNEGGLAGLFAGENSLAAFGPQMLTFGESLRDFALAVTDVNYDPVKAAVEAGKTIIGMTNTIPNTGGLAALFAGDNSLAAFGPQMLTFGESLRDFALAVTDLNVDAINKSVKATEGIVKVAKALPEDKLFKNETTIDEFGKQLPKLADGINKYNSKIGDVNTEKLSSSVSSIKKLAEMAKSLNGINMDSMKTFAKNLKKMGDTGVEGFVEAFDGAYDKVKKAIGKLATEGSKGVNDKKADYKESGNKLIKKLVDGIEDKKSSVKKASKEVAEAGSDSVKSASIKTGFYNAGKSMVNGFANGITDQTWKAEAKASAMAKAALKAAKKALDINSPSKEAAKLGYGIPEGLALGIDKMGYLVKNSSIGMADTALDSTSRILANIASVMDSDVDYQPTIRPVMDLSNIESGAGAINGLLSLTPSVDLLANVGAINASMNNRSQNGSNKDVISAINKLGDKIGNGGNTYSINGITYDDGSNISNAVQSLIRATRIEGRI